MYTVLIWGTGRDYNSHFNCIRLLELQGQISVVGVTSDDKSITASIDGYPFVRKSDIRSLDFDYCIVAVKDGGGDFSRRRRSRTAWNGKIKIDSRPCAVHSKH